MRRKCLLIRHNRLVRQQRMIKLGSRVAVHMLHHPPVHKRQILTAIQIRQPPAGPHEQPVQLDSVGTAAGDYADDGPVGRPVIASIADAINLDHSSPSTGGSTSIAQSMNVSRSSATTSMTSES